MTADNYSYIILITGTPGTGKTTLGSLLSEELQCKFIDSSKLFIEIGVVQQDPTGRYTYVIDTSKALEAISSITDNDSCLVVETHYPTLWIDAAETSIALVILLRTHPLTLYKRLSKKKWPTPKILENVVAEATNVIAEELYKWAHMTFEVDTSKNDPVKTISDVFDLIHQWRTGIYINWLLADESLTGFLSKWLIELDRYKYGFRE